MIRHKKQRSVGALNTTATSDISFMLLIFFLVTTSMNTDKGMGRKMPPIVPEELQGQNDVNKDMVLTLHIMGDGKVRMNEESADVNSKMRENIARFIVTKGASHIIELQVDRDADYDTYFQVQNQISRAYNELRNAAARRKYGRPLTRCSVDEQESIIKMYPQRIQEVVNF